MSNFAGTRAASLVVVLALVLSACGSENSSPTASSQQTNVNELSLVSPDNTQPITSATPAASDLVDDQIEFPSWVSYQKSRIQLRHPPELVVGPVADGESVQFKDPETNRLGGNDNCGLIDLFQLDATLVEQTFMIESAFYQPSPEPEVEFLEINGEPAARISGSLDLDSGFPMAGRIQVMHNQNYTYLLICIGFAADIVDGIFDSVTLVN